MEANDPYHEAKEFEEQGEFALAAEKYKQAIELGIGDQADAHQRRGRALARVARYEEAAKECNKALSLNPELHLAHGVLGHACLKQGKYELAEREFLIALRIKPDDVIALKSLAHIYFERGRQEETMTMLEEIIQYQPRDLRSWVVLADLCRSRSCLQQVIERLKETPRLGVFFQIQFYTAMFVTRVLQFLEELEPATGAGIVVLIHLVALLAPPFLSVPIGIVLLAFNLVLVFVYPRIYTYEGKDLKISFAFLIIFLNCAIYWGIVFLVRPWLFG